MKHIIAIMVIALSMFIGCEEPNPRHVNEKPIYMDWCVYDLVSKTEWHCIKSSKVYESYNIYHLESCDKLSNEVLRIETDSGAIVRTDFCSTCSFKEE